jgi:hypothetical protein
MADRITYVGLDVHKESIVVAVAAGGLRGEVREYGRIANTATALDRLLRKLGGAGITLWFCYEAGPCGYGIQRRLSTGGHECVVVAPSLIPKRPARRGGWGAVGVPTLDHYLQLGSWFAGTPDDLVAQQNRWQIDGRFTGMLSQQIPEARPTIQPRRSSPRNLGSIG